MRNAALSHPAVTRGSLPTLVAPMANILGVVALIAVNVISQAIPLNNQTNADISNRYPTLFTPDGFAFSIWGLIWLGLIGFAVYQALPAQRGNPTLKRLTVPFLVSCAGNIGWIFTFQYNQFALSAIAISILLIALIVMYRQIAADQTPHSKTAAWRWLVKIPVSVYLGWVSVATIADVALTLTAAGWTGTPLSGAFWAVLMLLIGAVLAGAFIVRHHDVALVLVFVWAYTAIVTKQSDTPVVAGTATVLAVLFVIGIIGTTISSRRTPRLAVS